MTFLSTTLPLLSLSSSMREAALKTSAKDCPEFSWSTVGSLAYASWAFVVNVTYSWGLVSLVWVTSCSSLAAATELFNRRICSRFLGELTREPAGLICSVGVTGVVKAWVPLIVLRWRPYLSYFGAIVELNMTSLTWPSILKSNTDLSFSCFRFIVLVNKARVSSRFCLRISFSSTGAAALLIHLIFVLGTTSGPLAFWEPSDLVLVTLWLIKFRSLLSCVS